MDVHLSGIRATPPVRISERSCRRMPFVLFIPTVAPSPAAGCWLAAGTGFEIAGNGRKWARVTEEAYPLSKEMQGIRGFPGPKRTPFSHFFLGPLHPRPQGGTRAASFARRSLPSVARGSLSSPRGHLK